MAADTGNPLRVLLDDIAGLDVEYEDDGMLDLTSVEVVGTTLQIRLDLCTFRDRRSCWRIDAQEVAETSFRIGPHIWAEWHDDHPLLLDHLEPRADLYFRGPASSPTALLGDLLVAHQSVMDTWRPVEAFLNAAFGATDLPSKLLTASHGLLASGPETLIAAYAEVLERHGLHAGVLAAGPAQRFEEPNGWVEETRDLHVLTLSRQGMTATAAPEDSYLVAERISCRRLDKPDSRRSLSR